MARTESILLDSEINVVAALDALAVSTAIQFIQKSSASTFVNATFAVVVLADGATPALNASLGNTFTLVATGNRTIAVPTNPTDGQKIVIRHTASGGARTLALNTGAGGFRYGSDITALAETASGKTDWVGCIYHGTDSFWDVVAYVQGY